MRKLKGTVVSDKMKKTRVVKVARLKKHPRYLKYYETSKKYKAHDENEEYKEGDEVVIEETKPISKDKTWRIVEKIEK